MLKLGGFIFSLTVFLLTACLISEVFKRLIIHLFGLKKEKEKINFRSWEYAVLLLSVIYECAFIYYISSMLPILWLIVFILVTVVLVIGYRYKSISLIFVSILGFICIFSFPVSTLETEITVDIPLKSNYITEESGSVQTVEIKDGSFEIEATYLEEDVPSIVKLPSIIDAQEGKLLDKDGYAIEKVSLCKVEPLNSTETSKVKVYQKIYYSVWYNMGLKIPRLTSVKDVNYTFYI